MSTHTDVSGLCHCIPDPPVPVCVCVEGVGLFSPVYYANLVSLVRMNMIQSCSTSLLHDDGAALINYFALKSTL